MSNDSCQWAYPSLTLSPSLQRVYLHLTYTQDRRCSGGLCDFVGSLQLEREGPRLLWTTVLDSLGYNLQAMRAQTTQGEEELLAAFSSEWLVLHGRTGQLLSRMDTPYGEEPYLLGDSRSRVLTADGHTANCTAYELQADGSWTQAGQVTWSVGYEEVVQLDDDDSDGLKRLSSLLLLSSTRQRGQLRAVEVQTGRTVWNASGYDILTGAWVTQDGFKGIGGAELALHPLNSSWSLASAFALNRTGWLLVQHALLDLTGQLLATSPTTPALNASVDLTASASSGPQLAGGCRSPSTSLPPPTSPPSSSPTTRRRCGVVSHGLLPQRGDNPLRERWTRLAAVDEKGVSLVFGSRTKPQLVGQRFPAAHTVEAPGEERRDHRHEHGMSARTHFGRRHARQRAIAGVQRQHTVSLWWDGYASLTPGMPAIDDDEGGDDSTA